MTDKEMVCAAISWGAYLCVRDGVFDRSEFVRFCCEMFDLFHDAEELGGPEAVLNRFQIREATLETIVKPILAAAGRDPINGPRPNNAP